MLGRILVFLGGLLVVTLFAALLIPFFVDWTDFRRDFEDQASRILGKKVVVHGAVEARLLPFPSVTLHDVRAGQDADGSPQIQVARFSMDAELAPFLSGEARIFDMRIEEPKARIRLLKDGTLDWTRGSRAVIPAKTVVLENVHISGGQIEFIDEQSGRNRVVSGLDADMSASSLAGPWKADGRAAIDGHAGAFSLNSGEPDDAAGRTGLRVRVIPDDHPVEVDLDGALAAVDGRPVYSGSFNFLLRQDEKEKQQQKQQQSPQGMFSAPRTKGSFELTNERVRIPDYRMELGGSENPYVVTGEATLDTGTQPQFLLTAEGQQIDVDRFAPAAVQSGKTTRVASVSVRQRIEAFAAIVAKIPVPQVPGKASIRLPALVSDDTTIRDIRLDVRPAGAGWQVDNAVAVLPGRTQLEAKGALTLTGGPAFNGDLLVASNQPSGLANWLAGSVDPAIRQLNAAGFSSSVSLTTQIQRFEKLELAIGDAHLNGRLERQSVDGKESNISIDLSGNEIDIDALKAIGSLALGDQVGGSVLDHRIAAKFKADRFNVAGVAANEVETVFSLAGGVLSLDKLTAGDVAGAQVSANGKLEGSLLQYAGKGTLNLRVADPLPFITMLRQHVPGHPLLERLQNSASWYANSDLTFDLSVNSEQGGANLAVSGTVNGSRLSSVAKLPDILAITDDTALSLEAVLKNQSTAILFGQAGLDPLPFDADGEGLISLKVNGNLGSPAQTDLRFSTERTHLSVTGAFGLSADNFAQGNGDIALESADIEPYLVMNGIGVPQLGGGVALKLNTKIGVDQSKVTLTDLGGQAGGNAFSANLAIEQSDAHKITGDVSLGLIDLAWLGEAMYGPVADPETGAFNAKPVSLPAFPRLDAAVSLKVASFHSGIFGPVSNFSAKLNHSPGSFSLEEMAGDWADGKISGRIGMATGEGAGIFRTKIAVSSASAEQLLWVNAAGPVATGRIAVDLSAEATGASIHDMLASAGGSGEIRSGGLVIKGLNPTALQPVLQAADGLKGEIDVAKVTPLVNGVLWSGEIPLGEVSMPFTISDGTLRMQNLSASTDQVTISGATNVDLAQQSVTADIDLGFNAGNEALAGAEPSVRLNFTGPLAEPKLTTDVSAMTGFLSLRAYERERRRVEALQASVLEKQRLRREAALYTFRAAERQAASEKAQADERARVAEEARLKAEQEKSERRAAEEKAAQDKMAAEKAAREKASQERQQQQDTPRLSIPPTEEVIRQFSPPPPGTATP